MINARSLRNKFSDLEALVALEDYDIIGITETWLNTDQRDYLAEYCLPGYKMFNCERVNRAGGGVLLYIKASLHPLMKVMPKLDNVDSLIVRLKIRSKNYLINLIYRPPANNAASDEKMYDQIIEMSNAFDCVIFGDFNLPVSAWGDTLNCHSGRDFYNNLLESALSQHVHKPTRGDNVLDLIFSTTDDLVGNVNIGPEFSASDHRIVSFSINFEIFKESDSEEKILLYNKGNYERVRTILADVDWNRLLDEVNIEEAWSNFTNILDKAVENCIPASKRRAQNKSKKPKWWNNQIKCGLLQKKRAYLRYKLTQNEGDKLEFERLRRETKKMIKQSKKNLEMYVAGISKSNPKEFYSYIRKKKVLPSKIGPLTLENGEHVSNEVEIAEELNKYFASVFTVEDTDSLQEEISTQRNTAPLSNCNFSDNAVIKALDKINANKTSGPDCIAPRVLKEAKFQLCRPLSILFTKSFNSSKIPNDWKLANVTPIQKKGDKTTPNNYRPISLTSVVCKLMESIIRDQLVTFLEENNLVKNSQHGFRNKRSCLTNLLDFYNEVYNIYDETKAVDVIYLDFQKAFDKVPHQRLLIKLKSHGVADKLLKWLEDWLSERKQRVVINGKASNWRDVLSGVPQGSVLGPILFIIYVNDIDDGLKCKISKFADDTKITSRVTTSAEKQELQSDLDHLIRWAEKWQMQFNVDKCKVLHIGSNNDRTNYSLNGSELCKANHEKDLGIIISNNLKPGKHVSEVVKTANKITGFIGRAFDYKSEKIILTLYNSLVRPHLEYCVQFWSPYYRKDIDKLERVQRKVTKMIPRLRNKPYEERLKELGLFSLSKRRLRGDLIEIFKMFRGLDNVNIHDYVTVDERNVTRSNGYKITGRHFRSEEAKHYFFNRVVNVWNSLPAQVVNSNTLETFKNRVDKHMATVPHLTYFGPQ